MAQVSELDAGAAEGLAGQSAHLPSQVNYIIRLTQRTHSLTHETHTHCETESESCIVEADSIHPDRPVFSLLINVWIHC